jgi:hypothetical protein
MLISGRDAPGEDALVLILGQLVEAIRYLEPISRCEQV